MTEQVSGMSSEQPKSIKSLDEIVSQTELFFTENPDALWFYLQFGSLVIGLAKDGEVEITNEDSYQGEGLLPNELKVMLLESNDPFNRMNVVWEQKVAHLGAKAGRLRGIIMALVKEAAVERQQEIYAEYDELLETVYRQLLVIAAPYIKRDED